MITGACLCGAVAYELAAHRRTLVHCHCSSCRKHHGAPFASFVEVQPEALRWLAGEASLGSYPSSEARWRRFCVTCGAVAPTPGGDVVLVPAGNLRGDLGATEALHAFVASKPAWHTIADASPQHAGAATGWALEVQRPAASAALPDVIPGSCLCGDVRFTVSGAPTRWMQCHCSRCRRGRSAAHGSNMFYPPAQFSWLTGRERVRSYALPEAVRFTVSFCTRCGGGAPTERANVPFVLVPAALLDAEPASRPQAHIHVASRASWYPFSDGLPQFAELPPA